MPTGMGSYAGTSSTHSGSVQAPGIVLSVPSLEVNEGGQATYTVSLETQPSGNVSVAIARKSEADLSHALTQTLNFNVDDLASADRRCLHEAPTATQPIQRERSRPCTSPTEVGADYAWRASPIRERAAPRCAPDRRPPGSQGNPPRPQRAESSWSGRILAPSAGTALSTRRTCRPVTRRRTTAAGRVGARKERAASAASRSSQHAVWSVLQNRASSPPGQGLFREPGAVARPGSERTAPATRACLALLAATALLALAAPAQAQTETWSGAPPSPPPALFNGLGCFNRRPQRRMQIRQHLVLSEDSFTYDSTDLHGLPALRKHRRKFFVHCRHHYRRSPPRSTPSPWWSAAPPSSSTTPPANYPKAGLGIFRRLPDRRHRRRRQAHRRHHPPTPPDGGRQHGDDGRGQGVHLRGGRLRLRRCRRRRHAGERDDRTLPMAGTLALDGTAVMADDVVTRPDSTQTCSPSRPRAMRTATPIRPSPSR